jgi:peptidoglycan/LPS O-acetylase OafA/YrhL
VHGMSGMSGTSAVDEVRAVDSDAAATRQRHFRPDIEGLRAVAVIAVVLSHASLGLRGGYVGVDVFFVISGFLITRQLFEEGNRRGKFSFAKFYARRARRILPAATVVTVATLAAAYFWAAPLRVAGIARDGLAAALFGINWRLAAQGTNYFQSSSPPSPFQHYWSLSVEEQFYIVWPLLLAALFLLFRDRVRRTAALVSVLLVLIVLSFWASAYITHRSQPYGYFGTHTRVWELALGALLAVTADSLVRVPRAIAAVAGWVGLAAIIGASIAFDSTTAYPGTVAALPVVGAGLIIAAGCGAAARMGPEPLLRIWPMRWTGKISYSLYLWHWPLLILLPDALGRPLGLAGRLTAIALAVVLSVVTYFVIEQPFQRQQILVARPQRALLLATGLIGASTAVALVLPGLVTIPGGHTSNPTALPAAVAPVASAGAAASTTSAVASTGPAASAVPSASATPSASAKPSASATAIPPATAAQIAAGIALAATQTHLPDDVAPSLQKAPHDFPNNKGCEVVPAALTPKLPCSGFGDPLGTTQVVLLGDSHAGMWLDGLSSVAVTNHWQVTVYAKSDCPVGDYPDLVDPMLKRTYTECNTWRTNVIARIVATKPALVVIGSLARPIAAREPTGLETSIKQIEAAGVKVAFIADIPLPGKLGSIPDCLSQHPSDIQVCNIPRASSGLTSAGRLAEIHGATLAGATVIDPTSWFCTATVCPAVIQGVIVYGDPYHITGLFGELRAPQLNVDLTAALAHT